MVSDSWKMTQNLQRDAVVCQDHQENITNGQMSIILALGMIFTPGLAKKQHGGKIPIGSH